MKINNQDISVYNARQHKVTYGYPARNVSSEWINGASNPSFYRNDPEMETVTIEIIVKGTSKDEIQSHIRDILSLFNAPYSTLEVKTDGDPPIRRIVGTLRNFGVQETAPKKWHKLTLTVTGISFQDVGGWMITKRQLPITRNLDASSPFGCQMVLNLQSTILTDVDVTVSGFARDRKGRSVDITVHVPDVPTSNEGKTVYIGELPKGSERFYVQYEDIHENPTLLSLGDGTPLNGSVGAVPRVFPGTLTVSAEPEEDGAVVSSSVLLIYLT